MKKEKLTISLQIILILMVTLAATWAVKTTYDNIAANVNTANLAVVYVGDSAVSSDDLLPVTASEIATYAVKSNFTVKGAESNPTDIQIYYDVTLKNINIGEGLLDSNFRFQLLKNGSVISEGNFKNLQVEKTSGTLKYYQRAILTETPQLLPSYSSTADSYEVRFYVLETGMSQEHMMNQSFSADLEISLYTSKGGSLDRDRYTNLITISTDLKLVSNIGDFKRGLYTVSTNCSNATSNFDTKNWEFRIKDLTNYSECTATFTEDATTYPTLYDHIITLWNNTDGSNNIYKESHTINGNSYSEYRYEGEDTSVNNYVWFNNELWRIIGAFPGGTPTTDADNLGDGAPSVNNTVKIIRDDAIGSFAWHKSNTNDWTVASLNTEILNNLYLNSSSGTCYFYSTSVGKSCSFVDNGLANVQDFIENATWNLGGYKSISVTTANMYTYERGTTVYSGRPVVTTGKVGLMYPSDYGYSVTNANCSHTSKNLGSYNSSSCGGKAWLLKYGCEWTNSPNSGYSTYVFNVGANAYLNDNTANNGRGVRPVLYLKSNVYVTNKDDTSAGSKTNPYKIAIR